MKKIIFSVEFERENFIRNHLIHVFRIFTEVYLKGYNFEKKKKSMKKRNMWTVFSYQQIFLNLVQFVQLNICSNTNNLESTHTPFSSWISHQFVTL